MLIHTSAFIILCLQFSSPSVFGFESPSTNRPSLSRESLSYPEYVHRNLRVCVSRKYAPESCGAKCRFACIEGFGPAEGLAAWLNNQVELEELSLIGLQLTNADVQAILQLPTLRRLDLRGCKISRLQLNCLKAKKSLVEFELRGAVIEPDGLQALKSVEALSSI